MKKNDRELHIICSALLTVIFDAKTSFVIGALVEVNDHKEYNCPIKHCAEDMASNIAGIVIGSLIKKIIK